MGEEKESTELLREVLTVQREILNCWKESLKIQKETGAIYRESLRSQRELNEQYARSSEENNRRFRESDELYRQQLAGPRWVGIVRAITMLGVVMLLGYVIFQ